MSDTKKVVWKQEHPRYYADDLRRIADEQDNAVAHYVPPQYAQLIASAPELLKVCKWIQFYQYMMSFSDAGIAENLRVKLKDVINKAQGGAE